ncbi:MAG TPA: type II toxin-antitoxin system prevent-host-death family antitoxin [Acidimicrobiales bacterium]|nr:type II toxin-antitoxin system prevent-host-death family antitoxin [Acidimicrobiales bacterium]
MATVTIRELRNHGGEVVDRVLAGESLTVTRDGDPVAVLGPVGRPRLSATALVERRRNLPAVDPVRLRADLDQLIDPAL